MSKPKASTTKKQSPKTKSAPKKPKAISKAKPPEEMSAPMKAGLEAVSTMPPEAAKTSKLDIVIKLLRQPEGATIDDLVAATGWQKHTVRACMSHALAKKRGYQIVSDKPQDGKRIYKIADTVSNDH